ncbi:MAG: hypothetical protein KJN95_10395 [Gammaproteobacteria bacterium]|nr:hypothetical protein [Woeseia sp.]MBT8435064.1 hypothetical protein [Gammaproteobacteria bacterium]
MNELLLVTAVILLAACADNPASQSGEVQTAPVASSEDFRIAAGSGWKGHLSYLDYSSGSMSRIPVEIEISEPKGRTLAYFIKYPGETQYNAREKIKFSRDGRELDGGRIVARELNADGDLVLVTAFRGEDNERPADIRMTYEISSAEFSISKQVRFDGESEYFLRNRYLLTR